MEHIHDVVRPPPLSSAKAFPSPRKEARSPLAGAPPPLSPSLWQLQICSRSLWICLFWTLRVNATLRSLEFVSGLLVLFSTLCFSLNSICWYIVPYVDPVALCPLFKGFYGVPRYRWAIISLSSLLWLDTRLFASVEARLELGELGFPLKESTPGVSLMCFLRVSAAEWQCRPTEASRTISLRSEKNIATRWETLRESFLSR